MIRGLVIGKFMPVHQGHVALIRFAAGQCSELVVSASYTDADVIDGKIRLAWLQTIFANDTKILPRLIKDDFDVEELDWQTRTAIWAKAIVQAYGHFDVVFSSEAYGPLLAEHLRCRHVSFDPKRKQIPISATQIRQAPLRYWEYLPTEVQPLFVMRICFFGPESTGKSTMAQKMALHYGTVYVPEVAREMITSNAFSPEDIVRIGHAQTARVLEKTKDAQRFLFCDTDLITTQIYSRHYLGQVPPVLLELERRIRYDHYFLFNIDVPWVSDGLRDLGHQRAEMLAMFRHELDLRKISYCFVSGNYEQREAIVREALDQLLTS